MIALRAAGLLFAFFAAVDRRVDRRVDRLGGGAPRVYTEGHHCHQWLRPMLGRIVEHDADAALIGGADRAAAVLKEG